MESSVFHFLFHFKMEIFYGPVFGIFVGSQNTTHLTRASCNAKGTRCHSLGLIVKENRRVSP